MPNSLSHRQLFSRSLAALALVALGVGLSGCAGMSDAISPAFADPAKYDLYDCKQLEAERKSLAARTAELQGLMTKAETGVAGPWWRRWPIAMTTLRCADSRSWPRSLAAATGARNSTPEVRAAGCAGACQGRPKKAKPQRRIRGVVRRTGSISVTTRQS